MAIESAADRLAMIQALDGQQVTIGGASIYAIFDNDYVEALDTEGSGPRLVCRTADVSSVTYGTAAVVSGANYTVRTIMPDGTGMTVLVLEEA